MGRLHFAEVRRRFDGFVPLVDDGDVVDMDAPAEPEMLLAVGAVLAVEDGCLDHRVPQPGEVEDLLRLRFPYSECLDRFIAAEVERWKPGRRDGGWYEDAEPGARSRRAR